MSLSHRLRYEILKRDGHRCRYCGRPASEVALVVDHVVPVALGGRDEPSNLAAACEECNSGKSSTSADAEHVAAVARDAERWAKALEQAAWEIENASEAASFYVGAFLEAWPSYYTLPSEWDTSLVKFESLGLPESSMVSAAFAALANRRVQGADAKFRYFAGICWSRVREIQDRAAAIIDEQDTNG